MVSVEDIIEVLNELQEDATVPKNIKTKLQDVAGLIKEKQDNSMNINKALDILEEISDDVNLQSHIRTRIWNVVSLLETV